VLALFFVETGRWWPSRVNGKWIWRAEGWSSVDRVDRRVGDQKRRRRSPFPSPSLHNGYVVLYTYIYYPCRVFVSFRICFPRPFDFYWPLTVNNSKRIQIYLYIITIYVYFLAPNPITVVARNLANNDISSKHTIPLFSISFYYTGFLTKRNTYAYGGQPNNLGCTLVGCTYSETVRPIIYRKTNSLGHLLASRFISLDLIRLITFTKRDVA